MGMFKGNKKKHEDIMGRLLIVIIFRYS